MTDYEEYVERFAKSRGITKEEAEQQAIVKEYKKEVGDRTTDSIEKIDTTVCGC